MKTAEYRSLIICPSPASRRDRKGPRGTEEKTIGPCKKPRRYWDLRLQGPIGTDIPEEKTHQRLAHARREALSLKRPLSVPVLFQMPPEPLPHPEGGYLPEWLAAEIRAGHPNAYRTYAVWTRCYRCEAIILTGLDDPCVAANAAVDPTPLSPLGELICSLEHRPTYRLHLAGTGARIQSRDKYQPPAGGDPPVVPAHRCTHRFPGFVVPPEQERRHSDKPPF